jgi:CubicO group peptidase (beta-lactamase class C family)
MMKVLKKTFLLLFLITLILSTSIFGETNNSNNYWPKENWQTSTPEEQGMDSERIYRMLKYLKDTQKLHSLLIIRNGYLVTEAYFYPYHRDVKQVICSDTKSITSALIGIALQKGLIKDIHQKALDFFPEYSFANLDQRKKAITIDNLLSMTSGLDWGREDWFDRAGDVLTHEMMLAKDTIQFTLDRPMVAEPGTAFRYNTGIPQLLSAIIQKTSGAKNTAEFAKEYLFKPLGITDIDWPTDAKGITLGGFNLSMTPSDMAKFGYLYLRHGVWDGTQVVPAKWVETSTQTHISSKPPTNPNDTRYYGYQWWINSFGYFASGWGGQCIFVIPNLDMVVVYTAGGFNLSEMIEMVIIPAVKSDTPLPPNPKTAKAIKKLLREIETPKNKPVPPLPETVARISGKIITCEPNSFWKTVSLRFNQKKDCYLKITWNNDQTIEYPVGLNGLYLMTTAEEFSSSVLLGSNFPAQKEIGTACLKGSWISANKFIINWQVLRHPERYDLSFDIDQNEVSVEISGSVMGHYETIKGKLQE